MSEARSARIARQDADGAAPDGDEPDGNALGPGVRDRILDTAEAYFAEDGYTGVSLRQITAAAGVNLAAVNYYFGSKLNLLREVFGRRAAPINAERMRRLAACNAAIDHHHDLATVYGADHERGVGNVLSGGSDALKGTTGRKDLGNFIGWESPWRDPFRDLLVHPREHLVTRHHHLRRRPQRIEHPLLLLGARP